MSQESHWLLVKVEIMYFTALSNMEEEKKLVLGNENSGLETEYQDVKCITHLMEFS